MKKKKTTKKLVLSKETVRNLEVVMLGKAAGGWSVFACPTERQSVCDCPSAYQTCGDTSCDGTCPTLTC
jgi:hypothetical protein